MTASSFALIFLQASVSCLLTTTAAWALLRLAQVRWPWLAERRAPWLLALLAGAATFILMLLPAPSWLGVLPATPQPGTAGTTLLSLNIGTEFALQDGTDDLHEASALPYVAWLWFAAYGGGLAWYSLRRWSVQRKLRALLQAADALDEPALLAHPAFARHGRPTLPVLEVEAPVSPMLVGLRPPTLLLPRHLRGFDPAQQALIVAHELMHLRRRDHLWQHAAALLHILLWFVPAAYGLRRRLQWAQELGCDRAVLAGRGSGERRSYAAALLAQLAVQVAAGPGGALPEPAASLPFGARGAQDVADRIRLIRDAQAARHLPLVGAALLLLLPALCAASVLLQPRFGWHEDAPAASIAAPGLPNAAASTAWQAPLPSMRVTSSFGSTNRPGGKPHGGMDFGAQRGTDVMAPAGGTVLVSTERYEGGARYGKVIVIDHGNGMRTLYAHLDALLVQPGEAVRTGQRIGLSGATGKVSGPHLHFEVQRWGEHIDPRGPLGAALARATSTTRPARS